MKDNGKMIYKMGLDLKLGNNYFIIIINIIFLFNLLLL